MKTVRFMVNAYYSNPAAAGELFITAQAKNITAMQAELLATGCNVQPCKLGSGKTVLVFGGGAIKDGYISFDGNSYQCDAVNSCSVFAVGEQLRFTAEVLTCEYVGHLGGEIAAATQYKQFVTVVATDECGVVVRLPSGNEVTIEPDHLY